MMAQRQWLSKALAWVFLVALLLCSSCCATDLTDLSVVMSDQPLQPAAQCVKSAASYIANALTNEDTTGVRDFLSVDFLQCLNNTIMSTSRSNKTEVMLNLLLPATTYTSQLQAAATEVYTFYGVNIHLDVVLSGDVGSVALSEVKQAGSISSAWHDGWFLDPQYFSDLSNAGGMISLTQFVDETKANGEEPGMHWADILPAITAHVVRYNDQLIGFPLSGDMLMMFYRKDLLDAIGAAVPSTWEHVLAISRKIYNQDIDGDGAPEFGMCFDIMPGCEAPIWLMSIAASHLQSQGVKQGIWFDLETMAPLMGTAAFKQAMNIFVELASLMPPAEDRATCMTHNTPFLTGQCAMTISWSYYLKVAHTSMSQKLLPLVGAAPVPGSTQVLDRQTGKLVPCTRLLCPTADQVDEVLVNRVTYMPSIMSPIILNGKVEDLKRTDYAYDMLSYALRPWASKKSVLNSSILLGPFRYSHIDLKAWTQAGYQAEATADYLEVVQEILSGQDIALDLRVPRAADVKELIDQYIMTVLDKQRSVETATQLASDISNMLNDTVTLAVLQKNYRASLNIPIVNKTTDVQDSVNSRKKLTLALILPAVLVPCTLMILLVFVIAFGMVYFRSETERLGRAFAPGVGKETTLVVTDIQDSTHLWEMLPAKVMDTAVKEHQQVIRRKMQQHFGYESATEGDSFIIAFHTPHDALRFCLDMQEALLHTTWPAELLEVEICTPLYMRPVESKLDPLRQIDEPGRKLQMHSDYGLEDMASARSKRGLFGAVVSRLKGSAKDAPMESLEEEDSDKGSASGTIGRDLEFISFQAGCLSSWEVCSEEDPDAMLIFSGLRVRAGMHSGLLTEDCLLVNAADSRVHYIGQFSQMAKTVSDCGQGCMITLSEATYSQLDLDAHEQAIVLHCGEFRSAYCPSLHIYQVVIHELRGRMGFLGSVRGLQQLSPGVVDAPLGCATVVALHLQGTAVVQSWSSNAAAMSLKLLHDTANYHLRKYPAYMLEPEANGLLAAFHNASDAVIWVLEVQALMLHTASGLRPFASNGQIGDECMETQEMPSPHAINSLHVKAGIDTNALYGWVDRSSGRLRYDGHAVQRAMRIASIAVSEQVLCSGDTYEACMEDVNNRSDKRMDDVEVVDAGCYRLKGLNGLIRIYHCCYADEDHSLQEDGYSTDATVDEEDLMLPPPPPTPRPHTPPQPAAGPGAPPSPAGSQGVPSQAGLQGAPSQALSEEHVLPTELNNMLLDVSLLNVINGSTEAPLGAPRSPSRHPLE